MLLQGALPDMRDLLPFSSLWTLCIIVAENQRLLLWLVAMATIFFFLTMVLTHVFIKPNLRLVRCTTDFIKILQVSEFPISLYVDN